MKKRIAFILLTLAVLLCLCPSFASSDEDKGARMVDHDPPIVTGITLDAASVTAPGTVIVTVTATDDISGVAYVSAGFRNAEADSSLHANFSTYGDGVVIGTIEIGPYTNAGTHTIEFVNLGDNADTYI